MTINNKHNKQTSNNTTNDSNNSDNDDNKQQFNKQQTTVTIQTTFNKQAKQHSINKQQ